MYDNTAFHAKEDESADFEDPADYQLWGCARTGLSICKLCVAHLKDFEVSHRGLTNFLEFLPRPEAANGIVMVIIEGALRNRPGMIGRELAIVSGVCWSPKVFEVALCEFSDTSLADGGNLPLPFECFLSRRVEAGCDHPNGIGTSVV